MRPEVLMTGFVLEESPALDSPIVPNPPSYALAISTLNTVLDAFSAPEIVYKTSILTIIDTLKLLLCVISSGRRQGLGDRNLAKA